MKNLEVDQDLLIQVMQKIYDKDNEKNISLLEAMDEITKMLSPIFNS
ncbi:hypothetical protein [Lederbergia citrea]|uniref:Uncharacterized protein n=1 Tax=Lederbergia citrea TaxID=2833581 RepID=A0A942UUX6_9BACI|nr:hypothetical protein [Lederbergia citrea]MBS4223344.1 hypothetical protein [Lederbergia citrea]